VRTEESDAAIGCDGWIGEQNAAAPYGHQRIASAAKAGFTAGADGTELTWLTQKAPSAAWRSSSSRRRQADGGSLLRERPEPGARHGLGRGRVAHGSSHRDRHAERGIDGLARGGAGDLWLLILRGCLSERRRARS